MIEFLQKAEKVIAALGFLPALVLLPIMVIGRSYEIIARKLFVAPSNLMLAIEGETFFLLVFLSLGYGYLCDSHVRIDLLRERWQPRTRAWVELAGFVFLMLPFAVVLIWQGFEYVALSHFYGEPLALAGGAPLRWLLKAVMPAGIALLMLAMASRILRSLISDPRQVGQE